MRRRDKPHILANDRGAVPPDFEAMTLANFDHLVMESEILYDSSTPEYVNQNGYRFEFRLCPALVKKEILARDDPRRTTPIGPFMNVPDSFLIAYVGPGLSHQLIFNKYCAIRPMMILHTSDFALQSSDLDAADLEAVFAVLTLYESRYMAIYNCGADAGSSQGHKHLQIFPRPASDLFPDRAQSSSTITSSVPNVPFKHFVLRIPGHATPGEVYKQYLLLLYRTREAHDLCKRGTDYNAVFTREWVCLIPRQHSGISGAGANAAGMLGLVWVKSEEERALWTSFGCTDYLAFLGIPHDDNFGREEDVQ